VSSSKSGKAKRDK